LLTFKCTTEPVKLKSFAINIFVGSLLAPEPYSNGTKASSEYNLFMHRSRSWRRISPTEVPAYWWSKPRWVDIPNDMCWEKWDRAGRCKI